MYLHYMNTCIHLYVHTNEHLIEFINFSYQPYSYKSFHKTVKVCKYKCLLFDYKAVKALVE